MGLYTAPPRTPQSGGEKKVPRDFHAVGVRGTAVHAPAWSNNPNPNPMKTTRLLSIVAALAGVATLGFAGAGPDYWARMNAAAKSAPKHTIRIKSAEPKAQPAPPAANGCTSCGCAKKT